jgi:hypothetical protein
LRKRRSRRRPWVSGGDGEPALEWGRVPLWKALISLAKKGVVRFAKMAGGGGGTRPAMPKHLEFPENRENNREFSEIPAVSAVSAGFWRPFALQIQDSADDSLFCTEQRICFAGTGNSSAGAGNCPDLDTGPPCARKVSSSWPCLLSRPSASLCRGGIAIKREENGASI